MRVGLATLQHGRHTHLVRQAAAVRQVAGLDRYLVVSMDDASAPPGAELLRLGAPDAHRLPLAAARNRAIAHLADCDLVVLLDVDCIPAPGLVDAFTAALESVPLERSVMFGPVGYLRDPASLMRLSRVTSGDAPMHVIRPFPALGVARETRLELFWSLAFAVAPRVHRAIGGFDEAYRGWGAEDTDYARRAGACGMEFWKVADAWAFHQPHPPVHRSSAHVDAVVENARRFHARWGDWPMPDVLGALARDGQILWNQEDSQVRRLSPVRPISL